MIGLLIALIIQGPFVSADSNCINDTQHGLNTTFFKTDNNISNWEEYKYTYIAIVMTFIFLCGTLPIIFFVFEKPGRLLFNF